jgi:hypothetical protein
MFIVRMSAKQLIKILDNKDETMQNDKKENDDNNKDMK